ncbi:MAG: uroporphyrinogen-III synthase [Halobacteriaceae archaeon]
MTDATRLAVALFRPDDGRAADTADLLRSLGADPVVDPMLDTRPTGAQPRDDADYVILTSTTGVDCLTATDWDPGTATVCAIGPTTADALREAGYPVDCVPEEYSSAGLLATLRDEVGDATVDIARSDAGSATLPDGLAAAGATVHETTLYRLVRPEDAGHSTELAAAGDLDAVLFTSPLTVEHFFDAATDRGLADRVHTALNGADIVVGAIGTPTATAARDHDVAVDVRPEHADIEALATAVVEHAAPTHHS